MAKWEAMAKESNDTKIKAQLYKLQMQQQRELTQAQLKRPERDLLEMSDTSQ